MNNNPDIKWLAPAKLNLFLHIIGRRDDGYHLLQTVFQLLDYGDELSFDLNDHGAIGLDTPMDGVAQADNLIIRAARLLQEQTNCRLGAGICVDKKLPMGGGVGGGSSDAATTLVALNKIWRTGLTTDQLAALGLQLGADVPVFVRGCSAWAEGVGEILQPVSLPERYFLVINPGVPVSTANLFSHSQLTRDCTAITIRGFHSGVGLRNVFQPLVCEHYPPVAKALESLSQVAIQCDVKKANGEVRQAMMTGTGACVFLACDSKAQAQKVLSALPPVDGFIARGVDRSALFDQ